MADTRTPPRAVPLRITAGLETIEGDFVRPDRPKGLILFAHGSGSSRRSPRNLRVAEALQEDGFATLLVDLLTPEEDRVDLATARYRFDIGLLAERLEETARWLGRHPDAAGLKVGLFGASTGAAAALIAAAEIPARVSAVVSRGGRPDLAGRALPEVKAPTLLIVGGADGALLKLNHAAYDTLNAEKGMAIVPGAGHLFEEHGALDTVAELSSRWFLRHLAGPRKGSGNPL